MWPLVTDWEFVSQPNLGLDRQPLQLCCPLTRGLWDLCLAWPSPRGEDDGGHFSPGVCAKCQHNSFYCTAISDAPHCRHNVPLSLPRLPAQHGLRRGPGLALLTGDGVMDIVSMADRRGTQHTRLGAHSAYRI